MKTMILDWEKYLETAREAAGEGIVLLKNDKQVLPLKKGTAAAVFGRSQFHYYRSGTGSGGMVNVSRVVGILDALKEERDLKLNMGLMEYYEAWEAQNPVKEGTGWGQDPWSQEEMPLTDELCGKAAQESDTALVVIGRTAGEDRDNEDLPGAYRLSETEEDMLRRVRRFFPKMVVLLNVGNVIDMSFVKTYDPDAVLYVWQGGMVGGYGVADVLMGRRNPSGKLADTIAEHISDYPSDCNFGSAREDLYQEDIYVGYRYFETAARDKVLYPFGFGLSYTQFAIKTETFDTTVTADGKASAACGADEKRADKSGLKIRVSVTNTGSCPGKEVVQVYAGCPQGKLGKPLRSLVEFEKTEELKPGETQELQLDIPLKRLASYDDSGVTGHKSCWVLEAGTYQIYVGADVRSARTAGSFALAETVVTEKLEEAMAPVKAFERMAGPAENGMRYEPVPLRTADMEQRRLERLPEDLEVTGDRGFHLADVKLGTVSMEQFVAQFSDEDLCCIIRGEGMGSPKVTPGTAAAFGGVSPRLAAWGIPCGCCDDGPSGMRLDCGDKAFSLPNGTLLACTFNRELNRRLFTFLGTEMVKNRVECLLGPGINIHRHPLNGRNFEYFSEDPYLTGEMASAQLQGMASSGVTGTIKHFCGNNQEKARHELDSVISERALREIYLKGFEIAVKKGHATSVMTTYGIVNGTHTASLYDLTTTVLRKEWGFCGIVMTDWWAKMNEPGDPEGNKFNFAAMVRAQNDLYMVCPDGASNGHGDNTAEALKKNRVTRGELQRCASNICRFLLGTHAMERMMGEETQVKVINCPEEEQMEAAAPVEFHEVGNEAVISLEGINTSKGSEYVFGLDLERLGGFVLEFTARSNAGPLAQITASLSFTNVPVGTMTWNGTDGAWVTKRLRFVATTRYSVFRLRFSLSGLEMRDLKVTFDRPATEISDWDAYTGQH